MTQFEDLKKAYFKGQQSTYGDGKHTLDYEAAALSEALSITLIPISKLPETWRVYFYTVSGYTDAYTKNLSDLWYRWLGDNGFTKSNLRGRLRDFYEDGTVTL
jgi:hypothetical protein